MDGKFVVKDFFQAILNPFMVNSVLHMFFATLETSLFVIGGISAWYLLKQRHTAFFTRSFKIALSVAIAVAPLQIFISHLSAEQVYHYQPTKLAAMEAQWETLPAGQTADWSLLALPNDKAERNDWEIKIPKALGYLLELKPKLSEPVRGLMSYASEDRPHMVGLVYYSFRTMVGIGLFLAALMAGTVLQWMRGQFEDSKIARQTWLLRAWVLAAPLGYIAVETGWIVRCVGRQPWTVYGEIRTADAASNLPAGEVLTSLLGITAIYIIFLGAALYFGRKILLEGPDLDLALPNYGMKSEENS